MYEVLLEKAAREDIAFHNKSGNMPVMRKIKVLLDELRINPRIGTGKPEPLKHNRTGQWSRRINSEHRLVYTIEDNTVKVVSVLSAKGHY